MAKVWFSLEKEYVRAVTTLNRTGILIPLPRAGSQGVIGIDGKEYPVPALSQMQELFARNKDLVDRKIQQGFTQLQLTPIAMPISQLADRVTSVLIEHAEAGKVFQTKGDSAGADTPVRVNTKKPLWVWEKVRQALDTPGLVYFPRTYTDSDYRGLTKEEVLRDKLFCAVPGWSVGLVEPVTIMPRPGHGKTLGGRKQPEACSTPRDYLQTLSASAYHGETGWTPEDFLTHFVTRLETTNQVSHDRQDGNALWLLGSYLPDAGPGLTRLVAVGYWFQRLGRIDITAHRSGNRLEDWVARSIVRLGT